MRVVADEEAIKLTWERNCFFPSSGPPNFN